MKKTIKVKNVTPFTEAATITVTTWGVRISFS